MRRFTAWAFLLLFPAFATARPLVPRRALSAPAQEQPTHSQDASAPPKPEATPHERI